MKPILLADDSSHAQRMGEQILREEGLEVIGLTDGETVQRRLDDIGPDLIVADAFLPQKSGLDLCRYVKSHPRHRHVRVILTAGLLEQFDEDEASRAGCDAVLKKPFEASVMMTTIRPLLADAQEERERIEAAAGFGGSSRSCDDADAERVQAAVTLALEAAMPALIHEITERVLVALGQSNAAATTEEASGKATQPQRA